MIKLNHLPDQIMDLVMDNARDNNVTAEKSVIILLESLIKEEAKRANNYGEYSVKNKGSSC